MTRWLIGTVLHFSDLQVSRCTGLIRNFLAVAIFGYVYVPMIISVSYNLDINYTLNYDQKVPKNILKGGVSLETTFFC